MKLEDLLKETPDALEAVMNAIKKANEGQEDKTKHVRYADLSEGGYVSKAKYEELAAEHQTNTTALAEANKALEAAKKAAGNDPELQKQIDAYKATVENLTKELAETKLNTAIITGLQAAGATDTDYLSYKLTSGKDQLKLGDDGKIVGWDEKLTSLKTQYPNQFKKENKGGKFDGYQLDNKGDNEDTTEPSSLSEALKQAYNNK